MVGMVFDCWPWINMVNLDYNHGQTMVSHGQIRQHGWPWLTMFECRWPWSTMIKTDEDHGLLWSPVIKLVSTMVKSGRPWSTIINLTWPWTTMFKFGWPWSTMVNHDKIQVTTMVKFEILAWPWSTVIKLAEPWSDLEVNHDNICCDSVYI